MLYDALTSIRSESHACLHVCMLLRTSVCQTAVFYSLSRVSCTFPCSLAGFVGSGCFQFNNSVSWCVCVCVLYKVNVSTPGEYPCGISFNADAVYTPGRCLWDYLTACIRECVGRKTSDIILLTVLYVERDPVYVYYNAPIPTHTHTAHKLRVCLELFFYFKSTYFIFSLNSLVSIELMETIHFFVCLHTLGK